MIFQRCHRVSVLIGTEEEIFEPGSQTVLSGEFHFYLLRERVTHEEHSDVGLCDYILSLKKHSQYIKAAVFLANAASDCFLKSHNEKQQLNKDGSNTLRSSKKKLKI